jgi:hypothetical protein
MVTLATPSHYAKPNPFSAFQPTFKKLEVHSASAYKAFMQAPLDSLSVLPATIPFDVLRDTSLRYVGLFNIVIDYFGPVVRKMGRYTGNLIALSYALVDIANKAIGGWKHNPNATPADKAPAVEQSRNTRVKQSLVAGLDAAMLQGMGSIWLPEIIFHIQDFAFIDLFQGMAHRVPGFNPQSFEDILADPDSQLLGKRCLKSVSKTMRQYDHVWETLPKPLKLTFLMNPINLHNPNAFFKALFKAFYCVGQALGRLPYVGRLASNTNVQTYGPMLLSGLSIPAVIGFWDTVIDKILNQTWRQWFGDPAKASNVQTTKQ